MNALDPIAVRPTLEKSLKDLCIDYLDLYLIHSPMGVVVENGAMKKNAEGKYALKNESDHVGIWREMEKLVDEGKIRVVIQKTKSFSKIVRIIFPKTGPRKVWIMGTFSVLSGVS